MTATNIFYNFVDFKYSPPPAFLVFWCIYGEITENFSFGSKKWLSRKEAKKYSESNFFLNMFEKGQILW